jgi:hypothetical protein
MEPSEIQQLANVVHQTNTGLGKLKSAFVRQAFTIF